MNGESHTKPKLAFDLPHLLYVRENNVALKRGGIQVITYG